MSNIVINIIDPALVAKYIESIAGKQIIGDLIKPKESKTQRFTKIPDGVLDNRTGLTWSNTLCDGKNVNQAKAAEACAELGDGWRLPTVDELFSLVDRSRHSPAINTDFFPDTKKDWYWTSEPYAANPDVAWIVSFSGGDVCNYNRGSNSACVRAVRPSQS